MAIMADNRPVFFFDIDNCLYSRSANVIEHMVTLIEKFFVSHLDDLSEQDAIELSQRYYKDYGLALQGLVNHHQVDAMEYNRKVDDALPLEEILKSDPALRRVLESFDPGRVKLWLLTNAYKTHGERVTTILGVRDLFDGITFCDYEVQPLVCKPNREMYDKAMAEAGVTAVDDCYLVDDSASNVATAAEMGWTGVHLVEPSLPEPDVKPSEYQIQNLEELIDMFPHFIRPAR